MRVKEVIRELVPPVAWRGLSFAKHLLLKKAPLELQRAAEPPSNTPPRIEPWQEREAQAALLDANDRRFIETRIPEVRGWLLPDAAYFTAYILNFQDSVGIAGPTLEIGVFEGKFLLLLHHLGRRHSNATVGLDIFTHSRPEPIIHHAEALFGTAEGLSIHRLNSADLTPSGALDLLGGVAPRAISVDGDHRAEGVLKDLHLSSKVLAERGVLIIDDILNPNAIGVVEGVFRFLLAAECDVVLFAYIANKAFACRREHYELYFNAARRFAVDCADLATAQRFLETREQGAHRVEQDLLGSKILIFS